MALLEGDEHPEMPGLSWNSVVKGPTAPGTVGSPDTVADEPSAPLTPQPVPELPAVPASAAEPASGPTPASNSPIRFEVSPPPVAPVPQPVAHAPLAPAPVQESAPMPVDAPQPVTEPAAEPVVAHPVADPTPPVADPAPSMHSAADITISEPVVAAPAVAAPTLAPAPSIPAVQPSPTLTLPQSVAQASPVVRKAKAPLQPPPQRKDRSGSVAKVGFFFLVVGALVSAAVIFGRPYLFPEDWEANALEFAEPIEAARGTEFVEPVLLTAQPSLQHHDMVADQLLADPASMLPMWRALGMAGSDSTDDATLRSLISELSPVLYSSADGQVYYDASFTRSDRSTLITEAMATAALDQEYSFSSDQAGRSLDDAALTEANVHLQAATIAQDAGSRPELPNDDMTSLAFLPVVLDYQFTAPVAFVDLLEPVDDAAPNPLTDIGVDGPGPLHVPGLTQLPSNSLVDSDVAVGSAIVTDRSFWYLSFAGHLDATTAYRMSTDLQGAGLQMVESPAGRCAVATFASADGETAAALEADLTVWAAASAPELGATVTPIPDLGVQLRSCDPVGSYTSNIRFGAARQLIGWRSIELSVTNIVLSQGGTASDVADAIAGIGATASAIAVAELPAGTAPTEVAAAARTAATDVVIAGASPADGES